MDYLSWPLYLSLCTLTGLYTLTDSPTHTHTHTQSSFTLLLLCLSYILMPSPLTPIHIYLYRSRIPAHCKYGTRKDPLYNFLLSRVLLIICCVFLFYLVLFLVQHWYWFSALLGLELAGKMAFHCTCARDIKTWNLNIAPKDRRHHSPGPLPPQHILNTLL